MKKVAFIDTSVLCNLVPVPGRAQSVAEVRSDLKEKIDSGWGFILPIMTVIETGNHIAHISNGGQRRETAQKFADIMRAVHEGKTPWILHDVAWNSTFLEALLAGADTGSGYVDQATAGVGMGDLCILTERADYERRTEIRATVWSLDTHLSARSD